MFENEPGVFGCVMNKLKLTTLRTGGVGYVISTRAKQGPCLGLGCSLTPFLTIDKPIFVLSAGVDVALTNEKESRKEGDLWCNLRIDAHVVGPMPQSANKNKRIALVWTSYERDCDRSRRGRVQDVPSIGSFDGCWCEAAHMEITRKLSSPKQCLDCLQVYQAVGASS